MAFDLVSLTPTARDHVAALLDGHDEEAGLRLSLKKGGCAGMEYKLDILEQATPGDDVIEKDGVRLFIDPSAMLYLLGMQIDYEQTKLRSGFVFNNPNQVSACGCGESVELVAPAGG